MAGTHYMPRRVRRLLGVSTRPFVSRGEAFILDYLQRRCWNADDDAWPAASDEISEWEYHRHMTPERVQEILHASRWTLYRRAVRRELATREPNTCVRS